jgi:hypothetical protein
LLRQRCDEIKRIAQNEMDGICNPPPKSQAVPKISAYPPKANPDDVKQQPATVPLQVPPGTFSGISQANSQNSISLAEALPGASPTLPGWWMGFPVQLPLEAMAQAIRSASDVEQAVKPVRHQNCADGSQQLFAKHAAMASSPDLDNEVSLLAASRPLEERTTVMLRNVPNNYSRAMLIDLLDSEGFQAQYDFLYLPIDFTTRACLGYGFVNLISHEVACEFMRAFEDFSDWIIPSRKHCIVSWSGPHQGLQEHIERYRNSPVMHTAVSDECKPIIFKQGARMIFPPPTKKIRAPRIRQIRTGGN